MGLHIRRSWNEPNRSSLTWTETWEGFDKGLIECWERGRQKRIEDLELAARAESGQLVVLAWRGGVEVKLKNNQVKYGTYQYLATWQGLRGEDLDIEVDIERVIVCSKTGQSVIFTSNPLLDDESA